MDLTGYDSVNNEKQRDFQKTFFALSKCFPHAIQNLVLTQFRQKLDLTGYVPKGFIYKS